MLLGVLIYANYTLIVRHDQFKWVTVLCPVGSQYDELGDKCTVYEAAANNLPDRAAVDATLEIVDQVTVMPTLQ